jgi:N-acetylmuramoyl-L-alanine amidase
MWLLAEARRFSRILTLIFVLILSFENVAGALEMDLMQGNIRKGRVSVLKRGDALYAALEEVMARLAFAPSAVTGGFVVTYSGKKIEFWNGSNAARINGSVFPLPSVVEFADGHWWGDANASLQAISTFLKSVDRPSDIRLAALSQGASEPPSLPSNVPVAPQMTPPPQIPPASDADGAAVSRVRWGEQNEAYRAVVDISRQVNATLTESPGRVEVVLSDTLINETESRSPWPPLSVSARQRGSDAVLTFAHSSAKVLGFWVSDPPRYVVDFFFGGAASQPQVPTGETGTQQPAAGAGKIQTTPPPNRAQPAAGRKYLVVIDAGHGGHDPGAIGNNLREKNINLLAATELAASLKALGADVKLTRADDRYLKLAERTEIANNTDADVFISLHCNAVPKGKHASGTELYLMAEQTDQDALNLAIMENRELSGDAQSAAEVN